MKWNEGGKTTPSDGNGASERERSAGESPSFREKAQEEDGKTPEGEQALIPSKPFTIGKEKKEENFFYQKIQMKKRVKIIFLHKKLNKI